MGARSTDDGRYGYWFPLVLPGFGLPALLWWDIVTPAGDCGWFTYAPASAEPGYVVEGGADTAVPLLAGSPVRDLAWLVLITVCLVGTVGWYAVRARRAGRSVREQVAVGAATAVRGCHLIARIADAFAGHGDVVAPVGLPLAGLGVLAGAHHRFGARRRAPAVVGVGCLGAGVAVVLGAWSPELAYPVLIAGGLLALPWFERSRLIAALAFLVPAALLVVPDGTLRMLAPAVVVLVAAGSALVRRAGAAAAA